LWQKYRNIIIKYISSLAGAVQREPARVEIKNIGTEKIPCAKGEGIRKITTKKYMRIIQILPTT
jgi:hypothetical protein